MRQDFVFQRKHLLPNKLTMIKECYCVSIKSEAKITVSRVSIDIRRYKYVIHNLF